MKTLICGFTLVALLCTSACGYFLYPERVGQKSGKIDPTIVLLDAAGLLVGIIPGVVAFAVDITTGAIYLPPGQKSTLEKHRKRVGQLEQLDLKPVPESDIAIDREETARELSQLLGQPVDAAAVIYYRPDINRTLLLARAASGSTTL